MRQAVFAILLILAAFSGGALVNGPGLGWAQQQLTTLAEHLPTDFGSSQAAPAEPVESDDDDGISIELPEAAEAEPKSESESLGPRLPRHALPVASASPFSDPAERANPSAQESIDHPDESGDDPDQPIRAPRGPSIAVASANIPESAVDSVPNPIRALPTPPPSLLDSARAKLANDHAATVLETTASNAPADSPAPGFDEEIESGDAARSSAAIAGTAASQESGAGDPSVRLASNPGPAGSGPQELAEWVEVHRRMVELGVGRFWVEGEFGGPVLFRCVVPVVGDRAVSQHFEAEGDDLLAAARVALKRIALWRATEDLP